LIKLTNNELVQQRLDMFFKPEPYDLYPPGVKHVMPVDSQSIQFTYILNITQKTSKIEQWLSELPTQLFVYMAASFLTFALIMLVDLHMPARHFCYRLGSECDSHFKCIQLRVLHLLSPIINTTITLSFHVPTRILIGFFLLLSCYRLVSVIICASIQTNLLVIDLSDVGYDLRHMLSTNREPCYWSGEKYINHFRYAQPNHLYGRVWARSQQDPCIVVRDTTIYKLTHRIRNGFLICELSYMQVAPFSPKANQFQLTLTLSLLTLESVGLFAETTGEHSFNTF
jgi:hypothetical protein